MGLDYFAGVFVTVHEPLATSVLSALAMSAQVPVSLLPSAVAASNTSAASSGGKS